MLRKSKQPHVGVFRWFLNNLISDIAPMRTLSIKAVTMMLGSLKTSESFTSSMIQRISPEDWDQLPVIQDQSSWQQAIFYDKSTKG